MIGTPATDLHSPGPIGDVAPGTIAGTTITGASIVGTAGGSFGDRLFLMSDGAASTIQSFSGVPLVLTVSGNLTELRNGANAQELRVYQTGGVVYNSLSGAGLTLNGAVAVLGTFTVGTVPSAATYVRGLIYVSDETGGPTLAFSDGTNWRRVQDRAVVS